MVDQRDCAIVGRAGAGGLNFGGGAAWGAWAAGYRGPVGMLGLGVGGGAAWRGGTGDAHDPRVPRGVNPPLAAGT